MSEKPSGGEIPQRDPDPDSVPAWLSEGWATGGPILGDRVVPLHGCVIRVGHTVGHSGGPDPVRPGGPDAGWPARSLPGVESNHRR